MPRRKAIPQWRDVLIRIGRCAEEGSREILDIGAFVGCVASVATRVLVHPRVLRLAAISRQVAETGVGALPIIG